MKNEAQLDYECVQMLFLLDSFKNKSQEIKSTQKLFLLSALLKHPSLLKQRIDKDSDEHINIKEYFNNNVEIEAVKQKKHINLDTFFTILGRLISKSLAEVINHRNYKQVRITDEGLSLLNELDDYEWYDVKSLSTAIKKVYGDKSFSQLCEMFSSITTILSSEA